MTPTTSSHKRFPVAASIGLVDPPPAGPSAGCTRSPCLVRQEGCFPRFEAVRGLAAHGEALIKLARRAAETTGESDFGALMTKRVGAEASFVAFWTFCGSIGPIWCTNPHGREWKPTGEFRRANGARGRASCWSLNGSSPFARVQQNASPCRPSFVCARAIRCVRRGFPVQPANESAPLSPRSVKA